MRFLSLVLFVGAIIFSTHLHAAEVKKQATPFFQPSPESLKLMKDIHSHNAVFDNYHTGTSVPYEPSQKTEGK